MQNVNVNERDTPISTLSFTADLSSPPPFATLQLNERLPRAPPFTTPDRAWKRSGSAAASVEDANPPLARFRARMINSSPVVLVARDDNIENDKRDIAIPTRSLRKRSAPPRGGISFLRTKTRGASGPPPLLRPESSRDAFDRRFLSRGSDELFRFVPQRFAHLERCNDCRLRETHALSARGSGCE